MERDERIGLLRVRVDALGDVDDPDSQELQLLHSPNGIRDVPSDARAVIDQDLTVAVFEVR